jgi:hypothetical protein
MAMSASSMKSKIEAAMVAAGLTPQEGAANQLLALCTGIIAEIQANAKVQTAIPVQVSPGTGTGATTATASIT